MERLQKVIAQSGICSRRRAEEWIREGKVRVNGKVVQELGTKVDSRDEIEVNGKILEKEELIYVLLNKPRGIVSTTSDEKGRKTVVDLVPIDKRIYPVGRLDYDTTGALLLTNDGEFSNLILHPSSQIEKVYVAKLSKVLSKEAIFALKRGVLCDGVLVRADRVKVRKVNSDGTCIVEITIHDGRNHQVKAMFASVGFLVDKLKRERIAFLDVRHLKSGEYRFLNRKEVHQLYALASKKETKKS